jgi:hypothetical protein
MTMATPGYPIGTMVTVTGVYTGTFAVVSVDGLNLMTIDTPYTSSGSGTVTSNYSSLPNSTAWTQLQAAIADMLDGNGPFALIDLAGITSVKETPVIGNAIDIVTPIAGTGQMQIAKRIHNGPCSKTWAIQCAEYDQFAMQLAGLSAPLPTSIQANGFVSFTPFSAQSDPVRGWFLLQSYDQNDLLVRVQLYWAELRFAGSFDSSGTAATAPSFTLFAIPTGGNKEWQRGGLD